MIKKWVKKVTKETKKKQKIGSLIKSILAAGNGVQSYKNRQEDSSGGKPLAFTIGGFIFTIVFILCVAVVVGLVLSNAN